MYRLATSFWVSIRTPSPHRVCRLRPNMSIEDLSDYTGIKPRNLENMELGRFDATIDIIANIASALGCTFDFVEYKK